MKEAVYLLTTTNYKIVLIVTLLVDNILRHAAELSRQERKLLSHPYW
jgi:hypothetical protein